MLRKVYPAAIPACLYMKFCIYERPGTFLVKLRTLYPYPCQLNYTQKKKKGSQSGCSIHPTSIMVFCRRQNILCNLFQGPHPHGRTAPARLAVCSPNNKLMLRHIIAWCRVMLGHCTSAHSLLRIIARMKLSMLNRPWTDLLLYLHVTSI